MNQKPKIWFSVLLYSIGALLFLLLIGVPLLGANINLLLDSGVMNDLFAEANLQAEINWGLIDYLPAMMFLGALLAFLIFKNKKKWIGLLVGTLLSFTTMSFLLIPKIELITQNAAIEFYENKQNEDCYIHTFEYFSYAHYFYAKKRIPTDENHFDINFLMNGKLDKPVYIICKITSKEQFIDSQPNFELLYEKNGFVFFVRKRQ